MSYIVKNKTRHEVYLEDLRAMIKPGRTQDLDMLASRFYIDQSRDLRLALSRGAIVLINKDDSSEPLPVNPVKDDYHEYRNKEVIEKMQSMEQRITEKVNAQLQKHSSQTQSVDPDSLEQLQQVISALQNVVSTHGGEKNGSNKAQSDNSNYDVPDNTAVEIHSRTIDRLTKDAKGNIKQDKTSGQSSVDRNIEELKDLL